MSAAASTFSRSMPVPNPMTPSGAMTAVFASQSVVEKILLSGDLDLSIANINAPEQIVISGCVKEIEKAEKILDEQSINYRRLPVSAAFHSKQIHDSVRHFDAFLRATAFHPPGIPVSSNATGTLYPDDPDAIREALTAQLTSPVRFMEQIENLYRLGVRVFIEVGPHTVLSKLIDECLAERAYSTVSLDRKGKNGVASFLNAMAMLSSLGIEVAYGNLIKGFMDETPEPKKYSPVTLKINGSLLTRQRLNPEGVPTAAPKLQPAEEALHSVEISTETRSAKYGVDEEISKEESSNQQIPNKENPNKEISNKEIPNKGISKEKIPKEDLPTNMNSTASIKDQNLNGKSLIQSAPASDSNWLFAIFELQKKAAEAQDTFQKTLTESHVAFLESSEEIFRMLSGGGHPSCITKSGTTYTSDEFSRANISIKSDASDISQTSQLSDISADFKNIPIETNSEKTEKPSGIPNSEMETVTASAKTKTMDKPDLKEILIDIVSEKTGYPPEMLDLDMELESDLGIDSIKRVEILAALKEKLPELGDANVSHVASLKTLREILAFSARANEINSVNKTETDFTRTPKSDPIDINATETPLSKQHGSHVPIDGSHVPIEGDQRLCFRHIVVNKALHSKSETNSHAKPETKIDQLRSETKNSTLPSGTLYIIADKKGIAAILARQLGKIHPDVQVIKDVHLLKALPASTGNIIFMKGLELTHDSDFETCERYLKDAFDAARLCGRNNHEKPGLFVTIQDSGGDFGLCNHLREGVDLGMATHLGNNAWAMGFSGLVKSCAREWPNACVKAIDINCGDISYEETAKRLFHEIVYEDCNLVEIGIRADGARSTLEVIHSESIERNHFFNENDVVVVTGGARGITAACMLALSQHCQLRIAILGRTILEDEPLELSECLTEAELKQALYRQNSENSQSDHKSLPAKIGRMAKSILAIREVRKNIAALEEKGSDVLYYSVDISEEQEVKRVIDDIRNQWGGIQGIIHGAGVIADTLIHEKTDEQYERVMNTKIRGLRALLSATKTDELTHLCCFSSIAARFGNSGQTDYAMANEVLNKVCRREYVRRGGKCLVKSINWGPWEGGMVTPFLKSQFEARGIPLISLEEGTRRFVEEMGCRDEHSVEVVIGSFDSGMGNLENEMEHLKSETGKLENAS
ncbi:hypothetical protein MTBBW1_1820001 [Desulfamplus magnetovallimortis]|uniref:Carrier domain-containing protein n=2 Tax=Desulfamplus magnetovallimortis TaxID=1246637 RepID=A0A1W1HAN7_9BACT|nr:hypothetical protein MTBBW1_1820001 [Desulfamplus magnetovallimortis]